MTRIDIGAAIAITLACACSGTKDQSSEVPEASVAAPEWLERIEIRVERTEPAFEQNTEVFLTLANRSNEPIVIEGLDAEGAASLQHEGGASARIHPISVGVKKPITVAPTKVQSASLLFTAAPGAPRTLRLYDRELPIPR